jgi:hypothetical protein
MRGKFYLIVLNPFHTSSKGRGLHIYHAETKTSVPRTTPRSPVTFSSQDTPHQRIKSGIGSSMTRMIEVQAAIPRRRLPFTVFVPSKWGHVIWCIPKFFCKR